MNLRTTDVPSAADPAVGDGVACGPIWLSPHEMCELRVRGHRVAMSEGQLAILAALISAQGKILSREELLDHPVPSGGPPVRSIDIQVSRIRVALGPLGRHIIAVRGRGYRVDVRSLAESR